MTLFQRISLLAFVVVLLYGYSLLPEVVGFQFNEFQQPLEAFHKSQFFYVTAGFVVFFNLLMVLFVQFVAQIPVRRLAIASFWTQDKAHVQATFQILRGWANGFAGWVNALFAWFVYQFVHHNTITYLSLDLSPYLMAGAVLLVVWMLALPLRFAVKRI